MLESLSDSPAVFLQGPRQTGKTTLVKALASHRHPARYLTLDDAATLAAARQDPHAFIGDLRGPVIVDEVQRVAELAMAIKASIDQDRTSGRFRNSRNRPISCSLPTNIDTYNVDIESIVILRNSD